MEVQTDGGFHIISTVFEAVYLNLTIKTYDNYTQYVLQTLTQFISSTAGSLEFTLELNGLCLMMLSGSICFDSATMLGKLDSSKWPKQVTHMIDIEL